MNSKMKRLLSFVLALAMVMSVGVMPVAATEGETPAHVHTFVDGICSDESCGYACAHEDVAVEDTADCENPGTKTTTCNTCGTVVTEESAAKGHSYTDGVCSCGAEEPVVCDKSAQCPAAEHSEDCEKAIADAAAAKAAEEAAAAAKKAEEEAAAAAEASAKKVAEVQSMIDALPAQVKRTELAAYQSATEAIIALLTTMTKDETDQLTGLEKLYPTEILENAVAYVGETPYESLAEAVAAGGTVDLAADVVLSDTLRIAKGNTVTLNLNGHTISHEKECTTGYSMIQNDGTLTVTGNGKLSFTDTGAGDPTFGRGSYTIANYGTLTVENGTVENLGQQEKHCNQAIFQYAGSTTIKGGTISTPNYRSVRIWNGTLDISGGEFIGRIWIQSANSSCTADVKISGGTFTPKEGDANALYIDAASPITASITGGTFNGNVVVGNPDRLDNFITGGTFSTDVSDFLPVRYELVNGTVAKTDIIRVKTAEELANALAMSDIKGVTLAADIVTDQIVAISTPITLDGNGHKLTSTAARAINITGETANGVVIKNLTVDAKGERAFNVIQKATNLTIQNVTAKAANYTVNLAGSAPGAVVTVKDSSLTGLNVVNVATTNAVVTVTDCEIYCVDANENESYGALEMNHQAEGSTITATGCTFTVDGGSKVARNATRNGVITIDGSDKDVAYRSSYISYGDTAYGFETLSDAVAYEVKNPSGKAVVLYRDETLTKELDASAVLLDLQGQLTLGTGGVLKVDEIDGAIGTKIVTNVADSKVIYKDGAYCVVALDRVAVIKTGNTETIYESVADAVAAAAEGDVVVLCKNVDAVSVSKRIGLDLNGMTVTGDITVATGGDLTITDSGENGTVIGTVTNNGALSIEGGTYKSDVSTWVVIGYEQDATTGRIVELQVTAGSPTVDTSSTQTNSTLGQEIVNSLSGNNTNDGLDTKIDTAVSDKAIEDATDALLKQAEDTADGAGEDTTSVTLTDVSTTVDIQVTAVEAESDGVTITYDITPVVSGTLTVTTENGATKTVIKQELKNEDIKSEIFFRLPVPSGIEGIAKGTTVYVKHIHEGTTYFYIKQVQQDTAGNLYIEMSADKFSEFVVEFVDDNAPKNYQVGSETFEKFEQAYAYAKTSGNDTVKLLQDVLANGFAYNLDTSITLDLNGYSMVADGLEIPTGTKLTIKDTSANQEGILNAAVTVSGGTLDLQSGIINSAQDTLLLNSGTVNISGGEVISCVGESAAVVVNGGTLNVTGGEIAGVELGILQTAGKVNITGGYVFGESAVYAAGSEISVSGKAELHGAGEKKPFAEKTATGDALVVVNTGSSAKVSVTGGTFRSENAFPIKSYSNMTMPYMGFVTGGTHIGVELDQTVIAENLEYVEASDEGYILKEKPCVEINGKKQYISSSLTLDDILKNAKPVDGKLTVKIHRDETLNKDHNFTGIELTIDPNGHKITGTGSITVDGAATVGAIGGKTTVSFTAGGKVTVSANGAFTFAPNYQKDKNAAEVSVTTTDAGGKATTTVYKLPEGDTFGVAADGSILTAKALVEVNGIQQHVSSSLTLDDILKNAEPADGKLTVKLHRDETLNKAHEIKAALTIDPNGHKITGTGSITVDGSATVGAIGGKTTVGFTAGGKISVSANGTITFAPNYEKDNGCAQATVTTTDSTGKTVSANYYLAKGDTIIVSADGKILNEKTAVEVNGVVQYISTSLTLDEVLENAESANGKITVKLSADAVVNEDHVISNADLTIVPNGHKITGTGSITAGGSASVGAVGGKSTVKFAEGGKITFSANGAITFAPNYLKDKGWGRLSVTTIDANNRTSAVYYYLDKGATVTVAADGTVTFSGKYITGNKDLPAYYIGFTQNEIYDAAHFRGYDPDMVITCNGFFGSVQKIWITGKDNYTMLVFEKGVAVNGFKVEEGSTVVTVSKTYLNNLKVGDYEISFQYLDGQTKTETFKVRDVSSNAVADDTNPKTGDSIMLAVATMTVSAAALFVLLADKRRRAV